MGIANFPFYGTDLGSAIETAENLIGKIKTNKFDKKDLENLSNVLEDIKTAVTESESED